MSDDPSSPYRPPPMARWKPPVLLAILAAVVAAVIAVSRATGDRGGALQTVLAGTIVVAGLVLTILVLAIGAVGRPVRRTALVMVGVVLLCLAPLGFLAATTVFEAVAIEPICERLETPVTTVDFVSRTSTGGNPITRFFTARLQCHYRTVDPAVPEGIPTSVDLSDERLAGAQARLWWVGHNLAGALGFVFGLLSPWLAWRWWFRTMGREAARDRADRAERGGGPDAGTRAVGAAAGRPPAG